jgi:hypothetical protein
VKRLSLFVACLTSTLAIGAFASKSEAAPIKLRKVSRLTAPQEPTTQHVIKQLKAAIETRCQALSKTDTVEILSEKVTNAFEYGGREVVVGKPGCEDQDLPCSAVPTKRVDTYTLRATEITLVRKSGGQRYHIKATTFWDLDLPMPQIDIQLESRFCK